VKKSDADLELDFREVQKGETIFREKGKCISCHSLRETPDLTLRAPSLLSIGNLKADDLRRAIENPDTKITPSYQHVIAHRKDGRTVEGRLVEKTAVGIYVLTNSSDGLATVFVSFREMDEADEDGKPLYRISKTSIMPSYKNVLTKEEIDALVAFLKNRHGGLN
jgi:putative heme-binding domain-containing protein